MKTLLAGLLALVVLSPAQKSQTFTGAITDSMCATDGHASMRMGPTDAECTNACVFSHGAFYVLLDGKNIYTLSDQKASGKFAGQKVRVVGTLNAKTQTIDVSSIDLAK